MTSEEVFVQEAWIQKSTCYNRDKLVNKVIRQSFGTLLNNLHITRNAIPYNVNINRLDGNDVNHLHLLVRCKPHIIALLEFEQARKEGLNPIH